MDRAYMEDRYRRTRLVCCALVMRKKGNKQEFLLVQEGKGPDTDKWNIPTGGHEPGETLPAAVIREVREETGGIFVPTHILCFSSVERRDLQFENIIPHIVRVVFLGDFEKVGWRFKFGPDIKAVKWFSRDAILSGKVILRSPDIPRLIVRHATGMKYPLEIIEHIVSR